MKGDGEVKMNTVEKQCVVHGCSRPAIVGSSQSVTLLSRNFLLDFKNVTQFIHISPARDIVKRFHREHSLGRQCVPEVPNLPNLRITFTTAVINSIRYCR